MDNTIISQGKFTSTGANYFVDLPSGVDWMMVYNKTQGKNAQTTAVGVKYYWQRGFGAGHKWVTYKSNAANAANLESYVEASGFTLYDTSLQSPGVLVSTITAISGAAIPVVTNTGVNGLAAGSIVRLSNIVGGQQLGGMDFTVGNNALTDTTFSLDYMSQIAAATTGSWRVINFDPIFYPRRRFITDITSASQAVVTLSVTHGYQVGQVVRMVVPDVFEMSEMNGLQATIVAIDTDVDSGNTITIDIDSSAFTPFEFALTSETPCSFAEVVPMGQDTGFSLSAGVNILSDATVNQGSDGMILAGGANCPGGAEDDVMYWVAGKSFDVSNT